MEIKLEKVTFEFTQEEHCMSSDMNGVETLTIECMSDLGISDSEEAFYVLKTEQWAIDEPEELVALLDKVKQAIDIVK
jgi:phage-related minor tail protein